MNRDQEELENNDPEESAAHENVTTPIGKGGRRPSRWLLLAVPVTSICFAGTKDPWALGLFALLVGLSFLLSPPKLAIPATVLLSLGGLLIVFFCSLLPISASSLPEWRTTLTDQLGLTLPMVRSPQPWVSFEASLMSFVGISWLLYCIGRGFDTQERQFHLTALPLCVAAFALAAIYVRRNNIEIPFWQGPWKLVYYGPFPNRNHFATLLAIGGVLGFAATYSAYRNRSFSWVLLALSILPIFAAMLLNTSRAGVVLFFGGLGLWMLVAGFRKRSGQRLAVFASVLLVLASGFIIFGKPIIQRFGEVDKGRPMTVGGSRFALYSDALNLFWQQPLLGLGLGNFEPVFALNKTYTDHMTRSFHPESDYLWLLCEAGGLAFILTATGIFSLVNRMGPFRSSESKGRRERRMRNSAGVGAFIALIHASVDTPAHTLGIWALVCLLVGIALRPSRLHKIDGFLTPWLYRICGVCCLIIGTCWILVASGRGAMPGTTTSKRLEQHAFQLADIRDYAGAIYSLNQAIALRPLDYSLYFRRAVWLLELGRSPQEALADFTRARVLEPHSALLCFEESQIWLKFNPIYSIPAIREAMQRDKSRSYGYWGYYTRMLPQMANYPELRIPLLDLANDPKLKLHYLSNAVTETDFQTALASLLEQAPNLESLSSPERRQLFRLWYDRGDRKSLISKLEKNTEWRADGWQILAENSAATGDFKGAYQVVSDNLPPPMENQGTRDSDLAQLRRDFLFNPTDIARGLRLYGALRAKGMIDDAIYTLEKVSKLPEPPSSVIYEQAVMYARKDDYSKAWERMKTYLATIPKDT